VVSNNSRSGRSSLALFGIYGQFALPILFSLGAILHPGLLKAEGLELAATVSVDKDVSAEKDRSSVKIEVRTVRADGPESTQTAGSSRSVKLQGAIEDLADELMVLDFSQFRMVDLQSLIIPAGKRVTIDLSEGQKLTLRPVSVTEEKVCLWLHWVDRSGEELLETRLRLVRGKNVLAGTEHSPERGLILALKVD
jgi:hypothetical protein